MNDKSNERVMIHFYADGKIFVVCDPGARSLGFIDPDVAAKYAVECFLDNTFNHGQPVDGAGFNDDSAMESWNLADFYRGNVEPYSFACIMFKKEFCKIVGQ